MFTTFLCHFITIFFIGAVYVSVVNSQDDILLNLLDNGVNPNKIDSDMYILDKLFSETEQQKVNVKLYYECLCPDCREFDTNNLKPTVEKLSNYLDLHLYPYGNAQTIEKDGHYEFKCQHGPSECYGNKLHACAIDLLGNITQAVIYNSCMMEQNRTGHGSDDTAADQCGERLSITSEPIKSCAKGDKGTQLLKYYGDESKKANFTYVPYVLINGVENQGDNFFKDLCAAFTSPPPPCRA